MRTWGLSAAEQDEVWKRWRRGESLGLIARELGHRLPSVRSFIAETGGIQKRPAHRSPRSLSIAEREEISRGLAAGRCYRVIATGLSRAPSSVSREVARNGGRKRYRAQAADVAAYRRARRPKPSKFGLVPRLRAIVEDRLAHRWSPEQVAAWLRRTYPDDPEMQVSHETIYLSLFVQTRGGLRRELTRHLRSGRSMRFPRTKRLPQGRGRIKDMVSISERPAQVADRAVPGHWEGDLLLGKHPTAVGTLVERSSRYVMLFPLSSGYGADQVRRALSQTIVTLPEQLRRSLTWDQGPEMAEHVAFRVDTGVAVYFCDPRSPWQRGSNENTNRLLRQYLPKGGDFRNLSQDQLNAITAELNARPRRTLEWRTPGAVFLEASRTAGASTVRQVRSHSPKES
jgi:IS30 family transposase